MRIEDCRFGRVVIDGKPYTRDVILFPDRVIENWWRKEGHSLDVDDLPEVFDWKPAVFVMGCGQHGALTVPQATARALSEAGIELVTLSTPGACSELNRFFAEGADAAGGLHLTC
jgi:hypothetical protein